MDQRRDRRLIRAGLDVLEAILEDRKEEKNKDKYGKDIDPDKKKKDVPQKKEPYRPPPESAKPDKAALRIEAPKSKPEGGKVAGSIYGNNKPIRREKPNRNGRIGSTPKAAGRGWGFFG